TRPESLPSRVTERRAQRVRPSKQRRAPQPAFEVVLHRGEAEAFDLPGDRPRRLGERGVEAATEEPAQQVERGGRDRPPRPGGARRAEHAAVAEIEGAQCDVTLGPAARAPVE